MNRSLILPILAFTLASLGACAATESRHEAPSTSRACGATGLAVQVLGSGGPIADDERASAGYVIWLDGAARLIVDLGGGTLDRLGAAGVDPREPLAIVLTHLHVDHSADFSAFLKSASFSERRAPLPIVGPSGSERFPPLERFVRLLVGEEGAYAYLSGYQRDAEPFAIPLREVDVEKSEATTVLAEGGLVVKVIGVPHGPVPTLGVVVEAAGARVGFTSDQRMDEERFEELVRDVDLLVAHHAIPEDASERMRALHAPPSRIGALASSARAGALVLSHHMSRSLEALDDSLRIIGERYDGSVSVASDLDCYPAKR